MSESDAQTLDGIKVVDFTAIVAGPYCTRLMADLGADVIKIEPLSGEHARSVVPIRDGRSAFFGLINAGKRSLALDLADEEGRASARELIRTADVVVENFRPGVMQRRSLDYESVAVDNPGLIYCSISGYGQDGPWSRYPAFAQTIHATSGLDMAIVAAQANAGAPLVSGVFTADALGGALAFGGIMSALVARGRSGRGRYVDVALSDAVLSILYNEVSGAQFPDNFDRRFYPPYETQDGYVMIAAVNQRGFEALAEAIGQPELVTDARFESNPLRWKNTAALEAIIAEWAAARTAAECEGTLLAVGVAAARYRTVAEALDNEQFRSRGTFVPVHDAAGSYQAVRTPFQFRSAGERSPEPVASKPVPDVGEHTLEVLSQLVGEIAAERMIARGAAGLPPKLSNGVAGPGASR